MKIRIRNKDVPQEVRKRTNFYTYSNTLFAVEERADIYAVYSYGTHFPLALHSDDIWLVNKDRYSKTTSRHSVLVRDGIDYFDWSDTSTLQAIILAGGYTAWLGERMTRIRA